MNLKTYNYEEIHRATTNGIKLRFKIYRGIMQEDDAVIELIANPYGDTTLVQMLNTYEEAWAVLRAWTKMAELLM